MDAITFTIYGEPMGKQRPKFSRQGNAVRTYTPSKTTAYEAKVRQAFIRSGGGAFWCGRDEYLNMCVLCYFAMPKGASRKAKAKMLSNPPSIYPKKPDCDNIAKIVADALNEVAYYDDSRIHKLYVEKKYTDGEPRVVVFLGKADREARGENTDELSEMD